MNKSMTSMDINPAINAGAAVESRHFGRKIAAIVAAGSFLIAGCSSDDDETKKFVVSESEFAGFCDNAPLATNAYEAQVGVGPFASNEAADAEAPKDVDIKLEAAEEVGQGNAMGVALLSATRNQQNSTYNPTALMTEAQTIFNDIYNDEEKFQDECRVVVDALMTEGVGTLGNLKSEEIAEFTNAYTDGVLTSLSPVDAPTQGEIPILGFRDANGALVAGISLDPTRDGHWVMAKQDNNESGQITPDTTADSVPVAPEVDENGNPIPVAPDPNAEIPVVAVPGDGETGPEAGEPVDNGCEAQANPECEGGEEPGEPTPEEPEEPETPGSTTTVPGSTIPGSSVPGSTVPPTTTSTTTTTTVPPTTTSTTTTTTTTPVVDLCPNIPGTQNPVPPGQEIVYIDGKPFCKDIRPTTVTTGNPAP